jgi:hypothetical protein
MVLGLPPLAHGYQYLEMDLFIVIQENETYFISYHTKAIIMIINILRIV